MATERSVMVRLRANADQFNREMLKARAAVKGVRDEIDTTNDRTAWLAQGVLALTPALVSLGAAAVPAIAAIATHATLAVGAVGTMALAFNGIGDALGALNKYQLEPTAENLAALRTELGKLGPDGADFVRFLDDVGEQLQVLKMDARAEMFPGMTEGIERALDLLPELRAVVRDIASGIGQLTIDAGGGIAGPEFADFFDYLDREAKPLLVEMGRTLGNFLDGFASMIVAFGPLTSDFSGGLLDMSRSFEQWAEDLDSSQGFLEFLEYVQRVGPKALDFFGSLSNAFVQFVQAAAPLGERALPLLTGLFNVLAKIMDTPVGSLLILGAALTSLYGRFEALRSITSGGLMGTMTKGFRQSATAARQSAGSIAADVGVIGTAFSDAGTRGARLATTMGPLRSNVVAFGKAAAPAAAQIGLLTLAMSGVAESAGLTNTTLGALLGSSFGKRFGVIGTAIGLTLDLAAANRDWKESLEGVDEAIESDNLDVMGTKLKELQKQLDDSLSVDGVTDFFSDVKNLYADAFSGANKGNALAAGINQTQLAITHLEMEMRAAERANAGYADTVRRAGLAGVESAFGIDALTAAIARQQSQARSALDATYAWGQAVIDLRNRVKEGKDGFNEFTETGQENYALLKAGADAFNNAAPKEQTVERYRQVRSQLIGFAKDLGAGQRQAEALVDDLLNVPKKLSTDYAIRWDKRVLQEAVNAFRSLPPKVQTDIEANGIPQTERQIDRLVEKYKLTEKDRQALVTLADQASGKIQVILSLLDRAHGYHAKSSITTTITTIRREIGGGQSSIPQSPPGGGNPLTDPVNRRPRWSGGWTGPGGKYEPAGTVHRDEVVLPKEIVRRDAPFLKSRYGFLPGMNSLPSFAGGGLVGGPVNTRAGTDAADREAGETAKGMKRLRAELKEATKALEKERKHRESLIQKMQTVRTDVTGGLRSTLFGEQDVWAGDNSATGILRGDLGDIRSMTRAIRELKRKGLSGPALAELLAEGGLAAAQAWADDMSRAELREYSELYNRRNRALRAVGQLAGNASYGPALRESRQEFRELKQEVVKLRRAVERNGKDDRKDHQANRESQRRGAGNARRSRRPD